MTFWLSVYCNRAFSKSVRANSASSSLLNSGSILISLVEGRMPDRVRMTIISAKPRSSFQRIDMSSSVFSSCSSLSNQRKKSSTNFRSAASESSEEVMYAL